MRVLSIDYGKKRTGIAVTDPLQIIANGLATVSTHELFTYIETYIQKEQVERIVLEEMENAYRMSVPLVADSGWGQNWLEAH